MSEGECHQLELLRKVKKLLKRIAIGLITITVVVVLLGMYKFNYLASKEGYDCDGNKITTPEKVMGVKNEVY
jgi:hypothetical protein